MGCDVACKVEATSPLTRKKIGNLLRCPCAAVSYGSNQPCEQARHSSDVTISTRREKLAMQKGDIGYISQRNFEPIIGCKHPIIALGATPIGNAGRAPNRKIRR
jgi:hypothetical protein